LRIFFNNSTFNNSTLIFNNNTITGASGATGGGTGATGVVGLAAFGCVFDFQATNAQSVPVTEDVLSNSNGPLHEISHTADTSDIGVNLAGVYKIDFAVYTMANNPQQWGVAVNGVVQSTFQAAGQGMVADATLSHNAGDIVTIRNVATVPNPATLRTGATGAGVQIDKVDSFQSFDSKLPSDSTSRWTVLPLANGWHYQPTEV